DGLGLGANARAALITRGLAEIQRMGVALGGLPDTFYGLTGMGDLVLTATGDLSRNRQVGMAIGQGQTLDSILAKGITAEGVRCANSALALGRKHNIDVPITEAVCNVLFEGVSPQQAVIDLLSREARPEQDTDSNLTRHWQQLNAAKVALLPPRFEHQHGHRIGKVQAALVRQHG